MSVRSKHALQHVWWLANPSEVQPKEVPVGRGTRWALLSEEANSND
jgi:hypothetical protein